MTTAADILATVRGIVRDSSDLAWTEALKLSYITDGMRAIAALKTDAVAQVVDFTMQAGVFQDITGAGGNANWSRLIQVYCNLDDSDLPARGVLGPKTQTEMDGSNPEWVTDAADEDGYIYEYVWDPDVPTVFLAHPLVPAGTHKVRMSVAVNVTALTADTDTIPIQDQYIPALIDYVLWRCWGGDSMRSPTYQKAIAARESFTQLLGLQMKSEAMFNPDQQERQ